MTSTSRRLRVRGGSIFVRLALASIVIANVRSDASAAEFRRGDVNSDGIVDLSDGVANLLYLFASGPEIGCADAADADDNGVVELTDSIRIFQYLFLNGTPLPAPGTSRCGSDPTDDVLDCARQICETQGSSLADAGHVLHRLAYGPTPSELERAIEIGVEEWIEEQLDPESIDEPERLLKLEESLYVERQPTEDDPLVASGAVWRYLKGTSQPPTTWTQADFDDSGWLIGAAGFGYGDSDDATILSDMRRRSDDPATPVDEAQPGYASVFIRKKFTIEDPALIDDLILRIDYDDGFAAFLNGVNVARRNVPSTTLYNTLASGSHEAGDPEEIDLSNRKNLLRAGENVLAIQGHNNSLDSSDFTLTPALFSRRVLPVPPLRRIAGIDELQQLLHARGIHSRRQLQAVLAEFWENHFTTDYDKLAEYFDRLQNSDGNDAMSTAQARAEAAHVEHLEYEFFYENALGNFGDLLLGSASSPAMIVYLDSVLNVRGAANENYAREIMELSAFGVDNRYTQSDIEELARAFTGWSICKIAPEDVRPFPESARDPLIDCGVEYEDSVVLDLGGGWRYFKGTAEPTPDGQGRPTTAWAQPGFDDSTWLSGNTGFGYGDGDDRTVLSDMRGRYLSVYLRREISIPDPQALSNLILEVDYDDGFVAYLNGIEVARSDSMEDEGSPPPFDEDSDSREAGEVEVFNLQRFIDIVRPAPETNVLAIQAHNTSLDSSDLTLRPRLLDREILAGSMENGDPNGEWVFRFDPERHDPTSKVIWAGTPYEIRLPAGRTGADGALEAIEVIDAMVRHPSTAEFISIKLIQRFVSDEISLASFKDGSAPVELRELLADMIAAWNSTEPPGHIRTVLRTLFDPAEQESAFWSDLARGSKVKTPIEFVNSTARILEADIDGSALPDVNEALGQTFFTRDDPDGWSEIGSDWIDTGTVLNRVNFNVAFADNRSASLRWDPLSYLDARGLDTPEEIIGFIDRVYFLETLTESDRELLLEFLTTDASGNPLPLDRSRTVEFRNRVQELIGLVLSLPQWHFQ